MGNILTVLFSGVAAIGAFISAYVFYTNRRRVVINIQLVSSGNGVSITVINKQEYPVQLVDVGFCLSEGKPIKELRRAGVLETGENATFSWQISQLKEDLAGRRVKYAFATDSSGNIIAKKRWFYRIKKELH